MGRMERRLRALQRDMDGIYDRLDAQGTALAGLAGLPSAVNGVN